MIQGTTKSGFAYEISDDALNDMRVVDALAELDIDNPSLIPINLSKVATLLLGANGKSALYKHIADENGAVRMDRFLEEMTEILSAKEDTKN